MVRKCKLLSLRQSEHGCLTLCPATEDHIQAAAARIPSFPWHDGRELNLEEIFLAGDPKEAPDRQRQSRLLVLEGSHTSFEGLEG